MRAHRRSWRTSSSVWLFASALSFMLHSPSAAQYLENDPAVDFAEVYGRLHVHIPDRAARDPSVYLRLQELKREPCDQKSVSGLATSLEQTSYRREAAESLYHFYERCGGPENALLRATNILLTLSDYALAAEVADRFVRDAPEIANARYLRGLALRQLGDNQRAMTDFADAIELYGANKQTITSKVFFEMAKAYAALGRPCEAAFPISYWVSLDPNRRDTSQSQTMIGEYERQGNCARSTGEIKERFRKTGNSHVVYVEGLVNGVKGRFILDTGASYLSLSKSFAKKARVVGSENTITLWTANGVVRASLSTADSVKLGRLSALKVPAAVNEVDGRAFAGGVDGLMGMSFLSRFDVRLDREAVEVRSRTSRVPGSPAGSSPGRRQ